MQYIRNVYVNIQWTFQSLCVKQVREVCMFQSPALYVVHSYGPDTRLCSAADVGCGPTGQVSEFWVFIYVEISINIYIES